MNDPYDHVPKRIEWRRFHVAMMVPAEYAQPTLEWLWERHAPAARKRMVVTHGAVKPTQHDEVKQLDLVMEYTAAGANKTDVRRKAWEALTKVAGTTQVQGRVDVHVMAFVNIGHSAWAKSDQQWLADKAFAAAAVADEITGRDWSHLEDDDEGYGAA